MTRREFIVGGSAAVAASAVARPVRSSLGGRVVGERLPEGPYDAEVEYLESTGVQYIDLGTIVPPDADFEFTGSIVNYMTNGCLFGETKAFGWGAGNPGYSLVSASDGRVYMRYGDNTTTTIGLTTIGIGNTFTASLSGASFKINGQSVATIARISSFAQDVSSMEVFRRNHMSSVGPTYCAARICQLKFGNLFDLIPVRFTNEYGETEGAMYDHVSGQLFRNQGTGSFIIGPDV